MTGKTANKCRIAVVQQPPVFLNLDASVERACGYIHDTVQNGADVVVFPETWLPGYPIWLDAAPGAGLWDHPPAKSLFRLMHENCPTVDDAAIVALRSATVEAGVYVVMGMQERDGGTLYNSILYIDPEKGEFSVHRKLMPTYTERLVWGRGDGSTLEVLETPFGNLGGLICWEHWMPLARAAMHARGETMHVAQWPWVKDMHQVACRHYAFEGTCFVVAAGGILSRAEMLEGIDSAGAGTEARSLLEEIPGADANLLLQGGSAVIGPDGQYVIKPVYGDRTTVFADIDPGAVAEARLTLDTDGHYSRPDVFELSVDTRPRRNVDFT
ncbi:MAG: carbon-nitrogen hydrolase family protein [Gammaproteobacteria bacterium]|nr:carbon-nitrogen hydrolase family protein [Gammaproteobacteria bacterium]